MIKVQSGFTLVELLVVVAIMALVGVVAIANFRTFGEDEALKNAAFDIVSLIRTAQTNATSNVKCGNSYGATWQVEFASNQVINLKCQISTEKIVQLGTNITINSVTGLPPAACSAGFGSAINFAPINGNISFHDSDCSELTVTLKNSKTGNTKNVIMDKGGKFDVQ